MNVKKTLGSIIYFFSASAVLSIIFIWGFLYKTSFVSAEIMNGMYAVGLFGQYDFLGFNNPSSGAAGLYTPYYMALDEVNHRLFVSDTGNNRVLVHQLDEMNNPSSFYECFRTCGFFDFQATYVIGQTAVYSGTSAGTAQDRLSAPRGLYYDSETNRLFVAEFGNNRVTVFDVSTSTMASGISATHVIGQANFVSSTGATSQIRMNQPVGVAYDQETDRLFVSQIASNRVTVYDASNLLVTSTPATHYLGQTSFSGSSAVTSQTRTNSPRSIAYDSENRRLFVTEFGANRVTVWNVATATIANGMAATNVIGQSNFTNNSGSVISQTRMGGPTGVTYDSVHDRLFVSEFNNHRVMAFNVSPVNIKVTSTPATHVLGQSSFTVGYSNNDGFAALEDPVGILYDGGNDRLYVASQDDNRIMYFDFQVYTIDSACCMYLNETTSSVTFFWENVPGATSYTVSTTATSTPFVTASNFFSNDSIQFLNLESNTEYAFQIQAHDSVTSSGFSNIVTTTTDMIPSISNVEILDITSTTATISWTTNKLTSSRIVYGLVDSFGVSTTEINTSPRVSGHEVTVTGLLPCAVYHYTPRVRDADGNFATTTRRTFSTTGCPFSAPVISHETSQVASSTGATFEFVSSSERLNLSVPAGFSSSSAAFQIKQITKDAIIAGTTLPTRKSIIGSLLFDLKAIAGTSTVISIFDEPVEVTMTYDPDGLDGADPATLSIFRYTNDVWTELTACTVNTSLFTVTCDTPGFSLFALMGEEGSSDSSSTGGVVFVPPTLPSSASQFSINQGARATNSRLVSLNITSPNASMVAVSTDQTFVNGSFAPLISPLWYTLPVGNGEKTIYIKLRTAEGGELVLSDTIQLTSTSCPLTPEHPYKSSLSSSVFYVTPECTRRPIPNERTYFTYFSSWKEVSVVTNATLTAVPLDPLPLPLGPLYRPTYGALIKTPGDPKVYVLINDTKFWITDETVFTKLNYRSSWIEDVDPRLLDAYKVGQEIIRTDVHPAFTLIKYQNSPKVYRLEVDPTDPDTLIKRWIVSESAFKSLNFRGDRIIIVDEDEVYEDGGELR